MGYMNNTTLTEAGERLLAKAETGTELKYTRIMVGDGQMTSDQTLLTMTTVISPVISVPITFCEPIFEGPTMAKVGGTFDNTQITTTFMYREVGLFALDPDDGEILYAYGNAGTQAEPIAPAADGGLIVERTPIILAIIGRAKNITAAIASGANVSNYEFNQYVTKLEEKKQTRYKYSATVQDSNGTGNALSVSLHRLEDSVVFSMQFFPTNYQISTAINMVFDLTTLPTVFYFNLAETISDFRTLLAAGVNDPDGLIYSHTNIYPGDGISGRKIGLVWHTGSSNNVSWSKSLFLSFVFPATYTLQGNKINYNEVK